MYHLLTKGKQRKREREREREREDKRPILQNLLAQIPKLLPQFKQGILVKCHFPDSISPNGLFYPQELVEKSLERKKVKV